MSPAQTWRDISGTCNVSDLSVPQAVEVFKQRIDTFRT
ncbi:hypothetical protein VHA_002633 [Grimontia hollisae CIP 101886]|uniref:Uncharacterized protein n=1 Tax=Grimontia hollisae CIP 101886 TaxID=675812 RepID=D0IA58_GRIHO|nr:hypothetical protein VHA_002633 [Grimontia hollisae CIP 101886]